jgi:hypothetical protein
MKKLTYCFDIDGTICSQTENQEYHNAVPDFKMIDEINRLKSEGHIIKFYTARGMGSGKSFADLTLFQLHEWGVNYDSVTFGKPSADIYVDDKALQPQEFLDNEG